MKVGDIVKSYDFVGNTGCYYIGEVVEILDYGFKAKTIKQVIMTIPKAIEVGCNDYFTAPFLGGHFMDDFAENGFKRVEVLG